MALQQVQPARRFPDQCGSVWRIGVQVAGSTKHMGRWRHCVITCDGSICSRNMWERHSYDTILRRYYAQLRVSWLRGRPAGGFAILGWSASGRPGDASRFYYHACYPNPRLRRDRNLELCERSRGDHMLSRGTFFSGTVSFANYSRFTNCIQNFAACNKIFLIRDGDEWSNIRQLGREEHAVTPMSARGRVAGQVAQIFAEAKPDGIGNVHGATWSH